MVAVVLSLAVALLPHATAAQSADRQATARTSQAATATQSRLAGHLPSRGVLVTGKTLAGIPLGANQTKVKTVWGGAYTPCVQSPCKDPTWLFFYRTGEPLGAAVRYRNNKVIAVFTLGAVPGWKSTEGLKIADPASKIYDLYGNPRYTKCIGYEALSIQGNGVVTSFYLTSGVIYGFALTVPGISVCQ